MDETFAEAEKVGTWQRIIRLAKKSLLRISNRVNLAMEKETTMASKPESLSKVVVLFEPRPDGGLRVCSDDVPGFILSHSDPDLVMRDIEPALEVIISEMLSKQVRVRLRQGTEGVPVRAEKREYVIAA